MNPCHTKVRCSQAFTGRIAGSRWLPRDNTREISPLVTPR